MKTCVLGMSCTMSKRNFPSSKLLEITAAHKITQDGIELPYQYLLVILIFYAAINLCMGLNLHPSHTNYYYGTSATSTPRKLFVSMSLTVL
jgi:hypothetical protein